MGIKKLVLAVLVLSAYIPDWVQAQSYPGGRGVGTITACPTIPELEGMSLDVTIGPGQSSPSSIVIEFVVLDGVVFGLSCDILFVPPSTLYIECGPHQAQINVVIKPFSAGTLPLLPLQLQGGSLYQPMDFAQEIESSVEVGEVRVLSDRTEKSRS